MEPNKFTIEDPKKGIILMIIYAVFSGAIVTYIGAALTTLEKRFDFNSEEIGFLMGANDIGFLISATFTAYYGSRKNRQPFILFLSGIGLCLSCLIYTTPYFIFGSRYDKESLINMNKEKEKGFCLNNLTEMSQQEHHVIGHDINKLQKYSTMFIMMVAGILNGIASTPFWSLGISFVDEMADATKSGLYIGILYGVRLSSALFGYLMGSYCLLHHESMKLKVSDYPPGQKDVKWVGAWWLGWLILGLSILIPTPFMLLLKIRNVNNNQENVMNEAFENSEKLKFSAFQLETVKNNSTKTLDLAKKKRSLFQEFIKYLKAIRDCLRNKACATILIGILFEFISGITLFTFFTKFLEYHYRVSASVANIMTAASLSGSNALCCVISGIISRYYNTTLKNMNLFHVIVNVVAAVLFPLSFIFSCQSVEIGGLDTLSRTMMCSDQCSCQTKRMDPICFNGTTYYSPCVAGCADIINKTLYTGCGCQSLNLGRKGFCQTMCLTVYGFLMMYVVTRMIGSSAMVQYTKLLMGFGGPKNKAVNLSISAFVYCICGTILPPMAGMVLDTACLHRNINKFNMESHCLVYDNDKMRYLILGIGFAFQIPACIFYVLSWHFTPNEDIEVIDKNQNVQCTDGSFQ